MATRRYNALLEMPERTKWDHTTKTRKVLTPPTVVRVFVEIDEIEVARALGQKAWGNKSKKAQEMGGLVRVVEVRPTTKL